MPYTDVYKQVEEAHSEAAGRKVEMREILKPLLNQHGIQETSELLGVSDTTISRWAKRAGVKLCWTDAEECDTARSA